MSIEKILQHQNNGHWKTPYVSIYHSVGINLYMCTTWTRIAMQRKENFWGIIKGEQVAWFHSTCPSNIYLCQKEMKLRKKVGKWNEKGRPLCNNSIEAGAKISRATELGRGFVLLYYWIGEGIWCTEYAGCRIHSFSRKRDQNSHGSASVFS